MKDLFGNEIPHQTDIFLDDLQIDSPLSEKIKWGESIIDRAIELYKPVKTLILVSGGHDSLSNMWLSANHLRKIGAPFAVYHGNTTIGIEETRQHVRRVCADTGIELIERKPPNPDDHYEEIVKEHGFPGATRQCHQIMYRRLKERAIMHTVTHEIKSAPHAREFVLLLSGARKSESSIRMAYQEPIKREGTSSRVWASPIFAFTAKDVEDYMDVEKIPPNLVKRAICISGECLCGAYGSKEERAEIAASFPHVEEELKRLEQVAADNGHPWKWSEGKMDWYKKHPPGQLSIFQPMCIGCADRFER